MPSLNSPFSPALAPPLAAQQPEGARPAPSPQVCVLMPIQSPLQLHTKTMSVEVQAGRAVTLQVQRPGTLRVRGARVWLTLTPSSAPAAAEGDVFLQAGQTLKVAPGQSLVVEPFAESATGPSLHEQGEHGTSCLDWAPTPSLGTQGMVAYKRWRAKAQGSLAKSLASPA